MLISVVLVAVTSIVSQTVSGYVFSADSRKPLVGSLVSILRAIRSQQSEKQIKTGYFY